MNRIIRCSATAVVAIFLLAGCMNLRATWLTALGLDLWTVEDALETLQIQQVRAEVLAVRSKKLLARYSAKVAIARDLVAGKKTLANAMDAMREICDADPDCWVWLRQAEHGSSDEERLGAHLLGWVQILVEDQPDSGEPTLSRFRKELRRGTRPHHPV